MGRPSLCDLVHNSNRGFEGEQNPIAAQVRVSLEPPFVRLLCGPAGSAAVCAHLFTEPSLTMLQVMWQMDIRSVVLFVRDSLLMALSLMVST